MKSLFPSLAALCGAAVLATASPANAMPASDPIAQNLMRAYYGNTRICREDHLFECHMWLNADGTYVLFGYQSSDVAGDPRHGFHVFRGTWTIEGKPGAYLLCRKQEDLAKPLCLPEPERPDQTGPAQSVGDVFWKYHEDGPLKGTVEHYFMAKGHV